MKIGLRIRTLAQPAALLAVLAVVACVIGVEQILSGFRQLEEDELVLARARARRVLDKHFATEMLRARDWSEWDDAASWLQGKNPGFPKSNLADSTLSVLEEDRLVYWDDQLKIRGELARHGSEDALPEIALRYQISLGQFPRSGLLRADSSLFVATIREVTGSSGAPPRRGWLALAHKVDDKMLRSLSEDLQCKVWIVPGGDADTSGSTHFIDDDSVVVGVPLAVEGGTGATLQMGLGRPLHRLGLQASHRFVLHFAGASISFVALALFLLERLVLSRLHRLTTGVDRIREEGTSAPPVLDPRIDEIGNLSRRIDEMVAAMRRSQTELAAALDEAQSANRARVNFLASMTHELRTPLNGVIGLTEYVLKTERDAESREALELSRGAALGLLETINGVLEFARLEKGVVDLVLDDADLESVVVEPVKVLASVAEKKGIALRIDVDPRLPRLVRIDSARLRQILNNLVGNAIKFTEQGAVAVKVAMIEASTEIVKVGFEVVDTGVGIPPDRIEAIFEPFEQATSETAIKFGGTGLGLTIAGRMARAMGGEIRVESALGEGSRFHFELALEVSNPHPLVAPLSTRRAIQVRVLAVDPGLRAMMDRILSQMNLQADEVEPRVSKRAYGSSHLVVLDSGALMDNHELASLPPAANLLVLADSEHVREFRIHLMPYRFEMVPLPTGPGAVAKAIEALAIPKARVLVAVSGIVLRGLVSGMIERMGLVAVDTRDCLQAIASVDSVECQLVVADLDDNSWKPLVQRCGIVFPLVGLTDAPEELPAETTVPKPVQAQRLLKAIKVALEDAPEGPDSNFWPSSGGTLDADRNC